MTSAELQKLFGKVKEESGTRERDRGLMLERLRNSKPSWETAHLETSQTSAIDRSNIRKWPAVQFQESIEEAPAQVAQTTTQITSPPATAAAVEYSFELEFDTVNDDDSVSIIINYGEINFEPPDGMTIDDVFSFDIFDSGTEIWARIEYDTGSLTITSRTLEFGDVLPDSTYGVLIVRIGFVDWDVDDDGNITNVQPHNTLCGDINVALIYGAMNASTALFALHQYDDPVPLS